MIHKTPTQNQVLSLSSVMVGLWGQLDWVKWCLGLAKFFCVSRETLQERVAMWVSDWGRKTRLPTGWGPTCRKPRGRQCERLQIPFLLSDTCLVVAASSSNARLQLLCPFNIDSVPVVLQGSSKPSMGWAIYPACGWLSSYMVLFLSSMQNGHCWTP